MAMALPAEVRDKYVAIIDSILESSDLSTISEKRIRKGIQERVQYDITPQKAAIQDLIMQRFDIFYARQNGEADPIPSVETADATPRVNGRHEASASPSATPSKREVDMEPDDQSDSVDNAPPKKKRKASVDEDAAFAARLQAEEDKRARPTRGGTSRKTGPVKKKNTPKKKTRTKITGSDDSDVDDDGHSTRKVNRDTGFHKPLNLSPALSDLFGEPALSRPQVTKRIWQYIKSKDLQDPGDKRFIICDDRLKDIFKQDKVHMFTMTKLLSQQMYNPDE